MAEPVKKVLIVDDEETLTWSMAKSLSRDREKYTVLIANTGNDALELLRNQAIDLAITDIRMPDINGLDLLTAIKNNYPGTKVIIMTAYGSSDIQREANKRGSLYYIEKPFEIADIRKLILDILWKKSGFEGKVFDLQLTDVIQLNCLGRVTAALKITKGQETGVIYFSDGEIVHAECDGRVGKDALFTILKWREGRFDHERGVNPPEQTISQNWEHLLVEGMRKTDEGVVPTFGGSGQSSTPSHLSRPEGKLQKAPRDDEKPEEEPMEEAVKSIARLAGCEGTMVVSEDGAVLAHNAIKNTVKEGALVAFLGVLSHRLSRILETGELHRILLGQKKMKVILRNRPYYFGVHLKEGVRFDDLSPSIRKTLESLREMEGSWS
jgi:DNA-binding response OmpR family regulator/predicted regulator of Ras-like GTPase activity (Roadblock/LC7/MglB family)